MKGANVAYFCPRCQGNELVFADGVVWIGADNDVKCALCGWHGTSSEILAAISPITAPFWTAERVGNALLAVTCRNAVGPLMGCLELIGLLPRVQGSQEEQASAIQIRESVAKALVEAVVTTTFEKTAELAPEHFARFDPVMKAATARIFSYAGAKGEA